MLQRDRQRQRERGTAGGGGAGAFTAEYLVVAGGGGGGGSDISLPTSGGGAGGYRSSVTGELSGGGASAESSLSIALGTAYTVTVGSGGSGGAAVRAGNGVQGSSSAFSTVTSVGGGYGAAYDNDGGAGGSGGGAGGSAAGAGKVAGTGTSGQGFDGGLGFESNIDDQQAGGGGGGAGQVGQNAASDIGGNGGNGVSSLITGIAAYRAGGGGGGDRNGGTYGSGGLGGGGNATSTNGSSGTVNTGGGGGAGSNGTGGNGGSGVVIIRVPSTVVAEFSAGVVYNYIPTDDFNVYEITAAGVSDTVTFSQGAVTTVGESLLFNDDDSAELTRTPSVSGNQRTWTYSAWVKRTLQTGEADTLFCAATSSTDRAWAFFRRSSGTTYTDSLHIIFQDSGGTARELLTTAVFRDPSAWYHVVVALDTTQSTASERAKVYVNGVQITDLIRNTYPLLNEQFPLNESGTAHLINGIQWTAAYNGDMYLSDVYLIDGEALDPSRFGKQDADGIWQPISYTGSYGTNGFHLDFADNSTAAALGTDTSGNGNDWTPSGITTDDQVTDTPSVNYATLNPLDWNITYLADGNLYTYNTLTAWQLGRGNFGVSSGKWYWETTGATTNVMVGIATSKASLGSYVGQDAYGWGYYGADGYKYNNATWIAYGATYTSTDVIGVAFDADNGTLEFYKNGTSQGTAFTGLTDGPYFPAVSVYNSAVRHNFGQTPFAHTPPTGFQALNSSNLPAPTITDGKAYFDTALYTGNGTTQAIGGLEFSPDFVWIKNRAVAGTQHLWYDTIRGATNTLFSSSTSSEYSFSGLTSFDANGFTVGSQFPGNGAGNGIAAWTWNAGGTTVANTDGSIPSQVRANTDAGFSIVSYTGTGAAATVGHGLGAAPSMVIIKNRIDGTRNWGVYHKSVGNTAAVFLDLSNAAITNAAYWNNTSPTSSVFSVANSDATNGPSDAMIAYCFADVDGFSKFGSYTGNGSSDGPFVYTGFRPAFVIMKSNTNGYYWVMKDNKRAAAYNPATGNLYPNDLLLEDTTATAYIDLLANGFKLRGNYLGTNGSGVGYIYMAFAENPFKTARAR